mmetsp:Transcript_82240/g.160503  ORF Transcript_82240/g.160503 Transcript_82240/m.160503 type:complete len:100 (-) Transcript_82240:967-1266(-)
MKGTEATLAIRLTSKFWFVPQTYLRLTGIAAVAYVPVFEVVLLKPIIEQAFVWDIVRKVLAFDMAMSIVALPGGAICGVARQNFLCRREEDFCLCSGHE